MTATGIPAAELGPRSAGPRPGALRHRRATRHVACPDHGLAVGADVGTATVRQLSARGQIADLIWEAPAGLTGEHGQLFRAAIQAYRAGQAEAAGKLWDQTRAVGPGPGRRTSPRSS